MTTLVWMTETGDGVSVHADGCRDIEREAKGYGPHAVEVSGYLFSEEDVVKYVMCDFIDDDNPWQDYKGEVTIKPCWKGHR